MKDFFKKEKCFSNNKKGNDNNFTIISFFDYFTYFNISFFSNGKTAKYTAVSPVSRIIK